MDAIECIKTRMSIRKFKPEPVPLNVLMEVIDAAKWSPSYKNSQPWEALIVSGEKKEALSKILLELLEKGVEPCPDIPEPPVWPPAVDARIACLFKTRCEIFGVDLNSPEIKKKSKAANFSFYGAPHGIFLFQDGALNEWSILDIGMFAQSLMLAAHALGLGTVPQAFLTDYAPHVKKCLDIPETKRLVLGLSIGYPDMTSKANKFRPDRIETKEIVRVI
ncbi:MAG: nitroreductase [Nitrospirae bacterium]|nr:nitroreductase [Nitrospirota bacterium]